MHSSTVPSHLPVAMTTLLPTRLVITVLALAHAWIAYRHGGAHDTLAIGLPPWKNAFVYVVIVILPLASAAAAWTRWLLPALWVAGLAYAAAAVFGVYHHYVLVSPDNIAHLPAGPEHAHQAFIDSAAWLALVELVAALAALYLAGYRAGRGGQDHG